MQAVQRALALLRHLAAHNSGMTLGELAESAELPTPTTYRLLTLLTAEEYAIRIEDKRYVLGPAALKLANGRRRLDHVASSHMAEVAEATKETTFLTEFVGGRAICTALVEGTRSLRLFVHIGQEMPGHASAAARAILAFVPAESVTATLHGHPLTSYTNKTPVRHDAIFVRLERIREQGYDICDEELDRGVRALSVPVSSQLSGVNASITVAGSEDPIDGLDLTRWRDYLFVAARSISNELGYG